MGRLSGYGTHVVLADGWEGEIYRRGDNFVAFGAASGEQYPTVVHLATFALPPVRGDFGGGALATMSPRDAFIALFEYPPDDAATALFAYRGVPWPFRGDDFNPAALRVALPNQSGLQRFFQVGGRPFCVYVVLGSHALRQLVVGAVNDALAAVSFD